MNTLQEKIEILKAMEKGLTIQYSETDGETDDWEDLLTGENTIWYFEFKLKDIGWITPADNKRMTFTEA